MGPDSHQTLDGERLNGLEGLVDALDPASHLSRGVDVVGLHLLRETLLCVCVCVCVCVCAGVTERESSTLLRCVHVRHMMKSTVQ